MNMLLGEKLKKARKNIGMSQNEVAEELMLSRQTISKYSIVCYGLPRDSQKPRGLHKADERKRVRSGLARQPQVHYFHRP